MYTEIHWINDFNLGRLGIMPRPRGGDWLEDEVKNWKFNEVDIIVSGLTNQEMIELDIRKESDFCKQFGIHFEQFPINDRDVPLSTGKWIEFIKQINKELINGKTVVAHCRMGIGRASLIAVSLMILNNVEPETAFQWTAKARGLEVPDTMEQIEWIHNLKTQLSYK